MIGHLIIHLAAPNTPNGNPNRVYVAIDLLSGMVSGAWSEGYRGEAAVPSEWAVEQRGAVMRAQFTIPVSATVARDYLKEGKAALAMRSTPEGKRRFG